MNFVEILAALAILTMSAFLLWAAVSGGIKAVESIQEKNQEVTELARLEFLFRREVGKLGPAYWEKGADLSYDSIYEEDGILFLNENMIAHPFYTLNLIDVQNTEKGVLIKIGAHSGKTVKIYGLYGRFPLEGKNEEP